MERGGTGPWRSLDASVALALGDRLEAVVHEMAEGITAAVPQFATLEGTKVRRDLREAVRVAVTRFVELIGTDEPALTPEVRETYVALGAAEAREDRGPEVLLAALRTSFRLLLREAVDALSQRGPVSTDVVVGLAEAVSSFIDELASASTDGYALQVREVAGERDRARHRLAELLVGGGASPGVVADAAAAIGWPRLGRMLPVLLPPEEAREARFRFGSDGLVLERVADVITLVRDSPRLDRPQLIVKLRGRSAVVGPLVAWPDLPETIRLTELTARLLRAGAGADHDPALVFVEDHLATLALKGEPSALAELSRRRLAPFAGLPESQRGPLLVTLESWLRHWGSRSAVAAELFVHPQTVSYRVRRARTLFGPGLDEPDVRFELMLVLADLLRNREREGLL